MTRKEYLLTCLIEELSEVQQELCKILRFTEDDRWAEREFTNKEHADMEWSQVHGVLYLLKEEGFELKYNPFIADEKIVKLEKFYKHSVKLKVVPEEV